MTTCDTGTLMYQQGILACESKVAHDKVPPRPLAGASCRWEGKVRRSGDG